MSTDSKTSNDLIMIDHKTNHSLAKSYGGYVIRHLKSEGTRKIIINKQEFTADCQGMMRMIRQITQTIGEYSTSNNPYAAYIIPALRKGRADIVSDLEHHFGVHWKIDEETGKSIFFT